MLLTTPEFLAIHAERFAASGRVGFVVIDEAHHAGTAKGGSRSAYTQLPQVLDLLGNPVMLAVTATAEDEVAREVCRLCGIDERMSSLTRACAPTSWCATVASCATARLPSCRLWRAARSAWCTSTRASSPSRLPACSGAPSQSSRRVSSFYNAGLTRDERTKVEDAFRSGELTCIVSTSAFGEGVNLPDIRDVVLYHLPFGSIEFNQMSGRAGRDGAHAGVHLMFGERDARINEYVSSGVRTGAQRPGDALPHAHDLGRASAEGCDDGSFAITNADIAAQAMAIDPRTSLDERSVSCGISVFRELGFLETSGHGTARRSAW